MVDVALNNLRNYLNSDHGMTKRSFQIFESADTRPEKDTCSVGAYKNQGGVANKVARNFLLCTILLNSFTLPSR